MRFRFHARFIIDEADVPRAVDILADILNTATSWDDPSTQKRDGT